jgi:hypothetical protein
MSISKEQVNDTQTIKTLPACNPIQGEKSGEGQTFVNYGRKSDSNQLSFAQGLCSPTITKWQTACFGGLRKFFFFHVVHPSHSTAKFWAIQLIKREKVKLFAFIHCPPLKNGSILHHVLIVIVNIWPNFVFLNGFYESPLKKKVRKRTNIDQNYLNHYIIHSFNYYQLIHSFHYMYSFKMSTTILHYIMNNTV